MFNRTKKDIALHQKLEGEPWMVEVDRGQMEQVLMNQILSRGCNSFLQKPFTLEDLSQKFRKILDV
jgi:hypothetical protein